MLDQILDEFIVNKTFPTIIDFVEAKWGFDQTLLPAQRFVFKLIYGLPLDKSERTIRITDKFNERTIDTLSELAYFNFLKEEERINLIDPPEKPFFEIIEALGRRGTKSTMSSWLSAYEVFYLLTYLKDPHNHFGITKTDEIRITAISNAKDQAELIFNQVKEGVYSCDKINSYVSNDTNNQIRFYTPAQLEKYKKDGISKKDRRGLVSVFVGTSNARSARGPGTFVIIMDEFAHFVTNAGVRSDAAVYEAITPALSAFGTKGKIICMSSPLNKAGKFYDLFKMGMEGTEEEPGPDLQKLVLRIPTWGMNSQIEPDYLRNRYRTLGKVSYGCEYGANFSDSKNVWMENEDLLLNCVDPSYRLPLHGKRYKRYYWGFDQSLKGDAFALGVTEKQGELIVPVYKRDYYASKKKRDALRVKGYTPFDYYEFTRKPIQDPQDHEDLVAEMLQVQKRFPVHYGIMDQWSGILLHQIFVKAGLRNIEVKNCTESFNSQVYELFLSLLTLGHFKMDDDEYLINQILSLEAERRSKNIIIVQAPDRQGYHDDLADALVRACWAALVGGSSKKGANRTSAPSIGRSSVSYDSYHAFKQKMHQTGINERRPFR
jgi:phage terminase large subunit-like protein